MPSWEIDVTSAWIKSQWTKNADIDDIKSIILLYFVLIIYVK